MAERDVRNKWIDQAKEYIDEAHVLMAERMGNLLVVTKLYHALIYALLSLYNVKDAGSSSHAELIDGFEKDWGGDPLNLLVVNSLKSLYGAVHTCGLPRPLEPDDEYVRKTLDIAVKFLKEVPSLLP